MSRDFRQGGHRGGGGRLSRHDGGGRRGGESLGGASHPEYRCDDPSFCASYGGHDALFDQTVDNLIEMGSRSPTMLLELLTGQRRCDPRVLTQFQRNVDVYVHLALVPESVLEHISGREHGGGRPRSGHTGGPRGVGGPGRGGHASSGGGLGPHGHGLGPPRRGHGGPPGGFGHLGPPGGRGPGGGPRGRSPDYGYPGSEMGYSEGDEDSDFGYESEGSFDDGSGYGGHGYGGYGGPPGRGHGGPPGRGHGGPRGGGHGGHYPDSDGYESY